MDELALAKQTFITESGEQLEEMERSLLHLENSPDDQDAINSLFRSAHTIKGSSGVLGLEPVEKFTHVVENLLSRIRDNEIRINGGIIELLLECRDHIGTLIALAAANNELTEEAAKKDSALIERLSLLLPETNGAETIKSASEESGAIPAGKTAKTDAWHLSLRFSRNVLKDGLDPLSFINYLGRIGEIVSLTAIHESMPSAEEMDPENCYLGFEIDLKSDFDKKVIDDVFEFVREESTIHILPPFSAVESYIHVIESLPEDTLLLGEILVSGGALTKSELEEALMEQREAERVLKADDAKGSLLGEILVNDGMVYPQVVEAALDKQKKNQSIAAKEAKTIRIDAEKLDSLINLVGELVIASANIDQHAGRIKDAGLIESASSMLRLVEEIRESSMVIRMVPIGETFSRFNRVVRDISRECEKDIDLKISGGETELDKTVVEKITDPLMHLVRNAADHGLEKTEERLKAGKSAKGTVRLNAYHDAGSIVIEVIDDGRGLNKDKILEKGRAVGLVTEGQQLSDSELFGLIFQPGFSTADKITKLSGRGVGMDVVKKNIEALRGTVEVESREGEGATVRIRLPLTLAIIDGFMVGVGGSSYVIPLDMVVECVELPESEKRIVRDRSYINLRGEALPYIRLRSFFREESEKAEYENIIIVKYAGQKVGLVVDELFGEVQTVIKSLGKIYKEVKGISGATIMGNGRVALILDIPRLISYAEEEEAETA